MLWTAPGVKLPSYRKNGFNPSLWRCGGGRFASGGHLCGPNLLQKFLTRLNHLIKVSLFEPTDCDICVAARVRS